MKFFCQLFLIFCCLPAFAQNPPGAGPANNGGERRGPPAELLDACKGKKEGDSATAKTPRGDTMTGRCRLILIPERDAPPARK